MAAEQKTGTPPTTGASLVLKEAPAATQALKELTGAANLANLAIARIPGGPVAKAGIKAAAYLGKRAVEGAREDAAYSEARTISNNYAGVTNDQLRRIERENAGATGSRAREAQALQMLVADGHVRGLALLKETGATVTTLNRVFGTPMKQVVDEFAELAKEPLKKSYELNRKHTYLGGKELAEIGRLEDAGERQAAADLAQRLYAVERTRKAKEAEKDRLLIDRIKPGLIQFGEYLEDIPRNLGRGSTLQEQAEQASKKAEDRRRRDGGAGTPLAETGGGAAVGFLVRPMSSAWNDRAENAREIQRYQAKFAATQGANASTKISEADAFMKERAESERRKNTKETAQQASVVEREKKGASVRSGSASVGRVDAPTQKLTASRGPSAGIQEAQIAGLQLQIEVVCEPCKGQAESSRQDSCSALQGTEEAKEEKRVGEHVLSERARPNMPRGTEGVEAGDKATNQRDEKSRKLSDDLNGAFREGFTGFLQGDDKAFDKMGESLKKKIVSSISEALYDASLKPAVEGFSKWLSNSLGDIFPGNSSGGGGGGDSGGNWLGSLVNGVVKFFVQSAKGNVFASPGLHAYANSVVGKPTFFPFANGIGLMGEAGPEAIMPLRRGSDGRLGVSAQGASGGGALHFAPTNVFNIDSRSDRGAVMADLDRALQANNRGQMEQLKRMRVVPQ